MTCAEIAAKLSGWNNILVLSHASPDGDTLGSAAALLRGFSAMGKQAGFACADPVPERYAYLFEGLTTEIESPEHIISVDVADAKLLKEIWEQYEGRVEIAIDHHGTHVPFALDRWVEAGAAANCELIYLLLKEMNVEITPEIAGCLYTGISTDTGCFRYANTTPRTLRIAADLMEQGAPAEELNRKLFETKSRAQVEAERMVMADMEIFLEGKCAIAQLPYRVYSLTGAKEGDLDGISSLPRQIEGVVLGVTVKEEKDGEIHASVRANPPADASVLCRRFGGGGHTGAAGCSFHGETLEEAAEKLKFACEAYLKELGLL